MSSKARIILTQEDGMWVARDDETGVASQGETREAALENLDDAIAGVEGAGREPTDEEIEALGVDPEVARSQDDELPDVLQ